MQNTNASLLSQQEVEFPWSCRATFLIHSNAVYGIQPCVTVQLFKEPFQLNKNDTLTLLSIKTKQTSLTTQARRDKQSYTHTPLLYISGLVILIAMCQLPETGQIFLLSAPLSSSFLTADTFEKPQTAFSSPTISLQM